jgi:hypothetical protein
MRSEARTRHRDSEVLKSFEDTLTLFEYVHVVLSIPIISWKMPRHIFLGVRTRAGLVTSLLSAERASDISK